MVNHTILLVQPTNAASRTYYDFADISMCIKFLVEMYEKKLKQLNPNMRQITYDIKDIYRFLDTYSDICALTQHQNAYLPKDANWVKKKIFAYLKNQA